MTTQESVLTSAKAVTDGTLANATITPDMTVAGTKGITQIATANLTPVPTPLPALVSTQPVMVPPIPPGSGVQAAAVLPDPALAFFLGGTLVILVLVVYEIYLWKKMKK